MKTVALMLALAGAAIAQTNASAANPDYVVLAGVGYSRDPIIREAFVSGLVGLGSGNYSKTTLDFTRTGTTMRTGFCKVFTNAGAWSIGSCIDAGVQATPPIVGSFAGGAFITRTLGAAKNGYRIMIELRITAATGSPPPNQPTPVSPGLFVAFGKDF